MVTIANWQTLLKQQELYQILFCYPTANSILVLYLSSSFNVPFGLNILTINGKVILA